MDPLQAFLEDIKRLKLAKDHLLGLFHVLIGRRISRDDGTLISGGMTWRELATLLKKVRWSKEAVQELGLNPEDLAPRDREKYWYTAIAQAQVNSDQARAMGDKLAEMLKEKGYVIGPAPGSNP
jgi:hypothetical protein